MTQEYKRLIFILDTEGDLGFLLSTKLIGESTVVFASSKQVPLSSSDSFYKIILNRKIPTFPNVLYSHFVLFLTKESQTLDYIYRCIKKAEKDKAECFVVMSNELADEKLIQHLTWLYRRVTVVVIGDVFGKGKKTGNRVVELLHQAKEHERVVVYENGLTLINPVYDLDIRDVLLLYINGKAKESRVILALSKQYTTELSFAHTLHKVNPNIHIDFSQASKKKKQEAFHFEVNGESALQNPYPYEKKLRESNLLFEKKDVLKEVDKPTPKSFPSSILRFVLIFLISILLFPLLGTICLSLAGALSLNTAKHAFESGDFDRSKRLGQSSAVYFTGALKTSEILSLQVAPFGLGEETTHMQRLLSFGEDVSIVVSQVSVSVQGFVSVAKGESMYPQEDFLGSMSTLKKSLILVRDIEAQYQDIITNDTKIPFVQSKSLQSSFDSLREAKQYISLATSTFEVAPQLLGFDKEKKYLFLFQNNMELRPGGGFIGSYALAKVKDGTLKDFSIHDVYDADGKLKGHIEPPMPIRRYLPSVHWYLRDSNFNVDFSKSASVSAMILQEETGDSVDGVIGIDVSFLKLLLEGLGPVEVSEYNETVTSENLYLLTQQHAEKNFFPGSTQKKDFLRLLSLSMQQKLENQKNLFYGKIIEMIGKAVFQKHLIVAFSDSSLQNVFQVNGMSNSLWDGRRGESNTIIDYLGINEANIGINKANYFIKRKVEYSTKLTNGKMQSTATVRFKNDSKAGEWPGGDYKNYIRFIVPLGTLLQEIKIDGTVLPFTKAITDPKEYESKQFKPPKELEVESYTQEGKTIFGFLITVPTTQFKTVEVSYVLPYSILESSRLSYTLKVLKQPGVDEYPFSLSVDFPTGYKLLQGEKKKEITIDTDEIFDLQFATK